MLFRSDRQNNQYSKKPFSFLSNQFQIPFNFADFQQLIVGNAIWLDKLNFISKKDSFSYQLSGKNEQLELDLWLSPEDYSIQKLYATVGAYTLEANFSDYQTVENQSVSQFIDLNLTSPESGKIKLKINYSKIEFETPDAVNFEIPEHYERKN